MRNKSNNQSMYDLHTQQQGPSMPNNLNNGGHPMMQSYSSNGPQYMNYGPNNNNLYRNGGGAMNQHQNEFYFPQNINYNLQQQRQQILQQQSTNPNFIQNNSSNSFGSNSYNNSRNHSFSSYQSHPFQTIEEHFSENGADEPVLNNGDTSSHEMNDDVSLSGCYYVG